jgi:hypothetical protein
VTLAALHELASRQELLADALVDAAPADGDVFGPLAAAGPLTDSDAGQYALLVESIFEGYLLHRGESRIVSSPDADLLLLAGDYFYALGLSRLAAVADLQAVEELADLITLCAQVHARERGEGAAAAAVGVTGGLWALSALAIAAGPWPQQGEAKRRVREGQPPVVNGEADAEAGGLRAIARVRASELGLELHLHHALIAFDQAVNIGPATT